MITFSFHGYTSCPSRVMCQPQEKTMRATAAGEPLQALNRLVNVGDPTVVPAAQLADLDRVVSR